MGSKEMMDGFMLAFECVELHVASEGDDADQIRQYMDKVASARWGWRWGRTKEEWKREQD